MLNFFEKCPGCGGALVITECRCTGCGLTMRGEFRPPQFATLSDDQLTFIRIFMRARGNLSEVEKVLGVSYPTIRNKLDEINKTLDAAEVADSRNRAEPNPDPADQARRAILQQVEAGQLSALEAVDLLRNLQGDV
ncbi:MAG: DUF2089 domain-containing protein [Anaerolineae bacterium]